MAGDKIVPSEGEPFDAEAFFESLQEELTQQTTGARKLCMRAKQCARKMTCEHAQVRNETADIVDLFKGYSSDLGDCENWYARRELNTGLDIIRKPRGGPSRHNSHADRDSARAELLRKINAGEPIPFSTHTPEELKKMLEESKRRKGK